MISMSELSDAWKAIAPQEGQTVGRRADENHPLDFFITYDENCNMQLMLLSRLLPPVPASSQQIFVRANFRHDKKYALCFSLTDDSLRDQFVSLCWDIMHCTLNARSETAGVKATVKDSVCGRNYSPKRRIRNCQTQRQKGSSESYVHLRMLF